MLKKPIAELCSLLMLLGATASPAFAASSFYLVIATTRADVAPSTPQVPADVINVSLTGATLPLAKVSNAYSESLHPYLTVTGDSSFDPLLTQWAIVSGSLPAGMTLSASGKISGTPLQASSQVRIEVQAAYKGKESLAAYELAVRPNVILTLNGQNLPPAIQGEPYSYSLPMYLTIEGDIYEGPAEVRWSVAEGSLPAGLSLNQATGAISGVPSAATGNVTVKIMAAYKDSQVSSNFSISVSEALSGPGLDI